MLHKIPYQSRAVAVRERSLCAATTQQLASRHRSDLHTPTLKTARPSRHNKLTPTERRHQSSLPHRAGHRKQNRSHARVTLKHKHVPFLHTLRHIAVNHARLSAQRHLHNRAQPAGVTVPVNSVNRVNGRKRVIAPARTRKTMVHVHAIPAHRAHSINNNGRVRTHSHSKQRHAKLLSTRARE